VNAGRVSQKIFLKQTKGDPLKFDLSLCLIRLKLLDKLEGISFSPASCGCLLRFAKSIFIPKVVDAIGTLGKEHREPLVKEARQETITGSG
jgi:hypothetical protein